jgi:hypothetical protein
MEKWYKIIETGTYINMSSIQYSNKSYILETSALKKEKEELRNCTFKPQINKSFNDRNIYSSNIPAYQRLYTDYEKIQNRKDLKKLEFENKESNMLSFSPDISLTSNKHSGKSIVKKENNTF